MVKRRVSVEGVRSSPQEHNVHVVVYEEQTVDGKPQEVPIGERFITIKADTIVSAILPQIRKAEREIVELAEKARNLRQELNELLDTSPPGATP